MPVEVLDRLSALGPRCILVRGNADRELASIARGGTSEHPESVLVDTRLEKWSEVFAELPTGVATVVCGHTHMPFTRLVDRRLVVNPGSIGIPYVQSGGAWALLQYPDRQAWADGYLRSRNRDADAIRAFGLRDGP